MAVVGWRRGGERGRGPAGGGAARERSRMGSGERGERWPAGRTYPATPFAESLAPELSSLFPPSLPLSRHRELSDQSDHVPHFLHIGHNAGGQSRGPQARVGCTGLLV